MTVKKEIDQMESANHSAIDKPQGPQYPLPPCSLLLPMLAFLDHNISMRLFQGKDMRHLAFHVQHYGPRAIPVYNIQIHGYEIEQ